MDADRIDQEDDEVIQSTLDRAKVVPSEIKLDVVNQAERNKDPNGTD